MSIKAEIIQGYPDHRKEFIDQRYKTYTLSHGYVSSLYRLENITTLLIYEQDVLKDVLLFTISKSRCNLLNSLVYIPQVTLEFFRNYIFAHYRTVKQIVLEIYNEIGYISLVTHNSKIIGALLCYNVDDFAYARMVAFDTDYYKYSVSRVLMYQSIVHSIEQQYTEYHLLWRNAEYMEHYGGDDLKLYSVSVFRSNGIRYLCEFVRMKELFCYRSIKSSQMGELIKPWIRRLKA